MGGVAQGVAGDRLFQAHDAHDVAGSGQGDLLAIISADVIEPRAVLFLVLAGVVHPGAGLETARVDPHEREVAVGVVGDLENQAGEWLIGAGLACQLGSFLGVVADDRRPIERAGQVRRDRIEQPLHADVLEA